MKSPDSYVFFILLHYASKLNRVTLLFDTGSGNKRRLINITDIAKGLTQDYCTVLMTLHAYTGCDSTSAFKGIGKVKPIKTLQLMPKFTSVLARLGDSWDVSDDLISGLEELHVLCMVDVALQV